MMVAILDRVEQARVVDPAIAEIDRSDRMNGHAFMRELIEDTRVRELTQ